VFIAFLNKADENHAQAERLIASIAENRLGTPYTSDHVFGEAVTVALRRTKRLDFALDVGKFILGETTKPMLLIARTTESTFSEAWGLFQKHAQRGLSFTDCASLALMKERGIDQIASFDSDFDGLVRRLH
jgi:predicted nucleic acid-binding protein